ncbi:hypothetical protein QJS10_CPA09g02030 [Acorus calamus]|uniref:Uncharacterized protein n=1 Tax=Acorus calamus TaxID=4465 RepID=A0AAV9E6I4_ACOCL|nr:hypothetical protein QJS10_CPA09g02030 [Acorus calamus]
MMFRFNWGACMQKKSESILNLLSDDDLLQQSRSKALKISKEIQGFGNLIISPSSSSSSSPVSTPSKMTTSRTSSFGSSSHSSTTSSTNHDELTMNMHDDHQLKQRRPQQPLKDLIDLGPIEEKGVVDDDDEEGCEKKLIELEEVGKGRRSGGDGGRGGGFRSLSDVGRVLRREDSCYSEGFDKFPSTLTQTYRRISVVLMKQNSTGPVDTCSNMSMDLCRPSEEDFE